MRKHFILTFMIAVLMTTVTAMAQTTGQTINLKCRENLRMLNEATASYISGTRSPVLPSWTTYDNAKNMLLGMEYLPKDPEPPTENCKYFLVSSDLKNYQWYCSLHGVLEGDKTISFRYQEHKLQARTSSKFDGIRNYKLHTQDLLRWTEYRPSPMENLKYYYNSSPVTTIVIVIMAFLLLVYFYRQIFV